MSPFAAGWLMPDENEQDALSKIKAYLDAGHSLDAIRGAGWSSWVDHLQAKGYDLKTGQLTISPPDASPTVETQSVKEEPPAVVPGADVPRTDQPIDTRALQEEIARRSAKGWQLVSHVGTEAQMRKPKHFSFVWAFLWFLLFGVGLIVYLFWHWSKREDVVYLRMLDGHLDIAAKGSPLELLIKPIQAWWTWSGQRQTTWGKVLAYGGPVAAIVILIIIISVASASGGGNGDQRSVAVQGTPATGDGDAPAGDVALEPTDTPEPKTERIVTAVPGAVAEADDVRITLNAIADPWVSNNQFIQPDPGRRFVAFDVTIENTGGRGTHGANIFNFRLSDAEDFAYEGSFYGPEPSLSFTDLGSGQKTRGWIAFEVNAGTPLQMLKYDPRLFSPNDIEFHFQ